MGDESSRGVPRYVPGAENVFGASGGLHHSLLTTGGGCVLSFGSCGDALEDDWGDDGQGGWTSADGRIGLGSGIGQTLRPAVVAGLTVNHGADAAT